jgi:hypothetical protein
VAAGLVATGVGLTADAGRLVHRRTRRVVGGFGAVVGSACAPVLDDRHWSGRQLRRYAEHGEEQLRSIQRAVSDLLLSFVPGLTGAVLDQLDLTALVRERVDLDALVADVDVVAIASEVIDELDLPQIVRESTGAMASETVRGVRVRTVDADQSVTRAVDRLLRRQTVDATGHVE